MSICVCELSVGADSLFLWHVLVPTPRSICCRRCSFSLNHEMQCLCITLTVIDRIGPFLSHKRQRGLSDEKQTGWFCRSRVEHFQWRIVLCFLELKHEFVSARWTVSVGTTDPLITTSITGSIFLMFLNFVSAKLSLSLCNQPYTQRIPSWTHMYTFVQIQSTPATTAMTPV